jgi:hypothetical protein
MARCVHHKSEVLMGWDWVHLVLRPLFGLLCQPQMINDDCGAIGGKYSDKTCPSSTLSTTNSTWIYPDSNPGRQGGKPATNRLSYGTAKSEVTATWTLSSQICLVQCYRCTDFIPSVFISWSPLKYSEDILSTAGLDLLHLWQEYRLILYLAEFWTNMDGEKTINIEAEYF